MTTPPGPPSEPEPRPGVFTTPDLAVLTIQQDGKVKPLPPEGPDPRRKRRRGKRR